MVDIGWFTPDGEPVSDAPWNTGFAKSLGIFLNGDAIAGRGPRGERISDASFYLLFNTHHEPLDFTLPRRDWGRRWTKVLDTRDDVPKEYADVIEAGQQVSCEGRCVVVLRRTD